MRRKAWEQLTALHILPRASFHANLRAEQRHAGDGLQRPLVPRSRFQPHLMPGVDMTSAVK